MSKEVDVVATRINKHQLYFECPYCRSSYYKNGRPRHNSKPIMHIHGSEGDLSNRITERTPHCSQKTDFTFRIKIDNTTIRE